MRYLLLLKRLLRKKSYIVMLLLVPILFFVLKGVAQENGHIMAVGVYVAGEDDSSKMLRESLGESESSIQYVSYESEDELRKAVANKTIDEGWITPFDLDGLVEGMAVSSIPSEKIKVVVRENGLSHLLGKEILCSKVYPAVAKQLYLNYAAALGLNADDKNFDSFGLSNSLFEMGYLDQEEVSDTSLILMPLRGILAVWLLLCGIAASMYYIEDRNNKIFIWWKTRFTFLRDLGYYGVVFLMPTIITIAGLIYSGSFTTVLREIPALLLYEVAVILLAMLLRMVLGSIKNLGILTPDLIIVVTILSPVFIDLKEARQVQRFCPTFHYLSSIHDTYYLKTLFIYTVLLGCLVVLFLKLPVKVRQVFKAHLL